MWAPAALPPTKETARMCLLSQAKFTVSCPPCTTLSTPGGKPQSFAISASMTVVRGTRSDGFISMVLPAAQAVGNIQSGIMAGKLNGAMPAHTPRGILYEWTSTAVATFARVSPWSMDGMPQAISTTSRPRKMSPLASAIVLPCSSVKTLAMASVLSRMAPSSLCMTRARVLGGVSRHDLKASAQESTARSSSAGVHCGVRAMSSPVAGLCTS
mmetsp:Transcript_38013/g.61261  ORF Transcript_38013/g.61261 Transcript_38013/m.61261 type:complete len:213 (+) Transcript_38013:960-1598(+)